LTSFEIGDLVKVPFPYVEKDRDAVRPALVIGRPVGVEGLVWAMMITSARRGQWPGDVPTGDDHASYGLPVPCFIRTAKIATLACASIDRVLGRLPDPLLKIVREHLAAAFT
jgi:mRNA interferase MazF